MLQITRVAKILTQDAEVTEPRPVPVEREKDALALQRDNGREGRSLSTLYCDPSPIV